MYVFRSWIVEIRGVPEQNFEEILNFFEDTLETEFCALHNGTISLKLSWIASELEWLWKNCVAKNDEKTEVFKGCHSNGET